MYVAAFHKVAYFLYFDFHVCYPRNVIYMFALKMLVGRDDMLFGICAGISRLS